MSELVYYKRNVPYVIGGRFTLDDWKGFTLTSENPYVAVKVENLRDFKIANKRLILEGLMIESEEPVIDWETPNAITDEKAAELVKSFIGLKNTLPSLTSIAAVDKLLETARELDRPRKTIQLIQKRLDELAGDSEEDFVSRAEMRGVE